MGRGGHRWQPRRAGLRISYLRGGKTLAVATIGRDREGLEAEAAFERTIASQER